MNKIGAVNNTICNYFKIVIYFTVIIIKTAVKILKIGTLNVHICLHFSFSSQ